MTRCWSVDVEAITCSNPPAAHPRRKEWAEQHGLPDFVSPKYDAALEAVCGRLGVHTGFKHRWVGGWALLDFAFPRSPSPSCVAVCDGWFGDRPLPCLLSSI